jgi:hypothetical protein
MGHVSPHMIFSNYREIVTPEEAERYWQSFPRNSRKCRANGAAVPNASSLHKSPIRRYL